MLRFPTTLPGHDAVAFLAQCWQKAPLWMPGAADPSALPDLEPDELAWLATEDDVESRLVITETRHGTPFYRMEAGPFEASRLEALPESGWTLLIQDAEKHLPELRRFFELVPFVPDWRIDDLMISIAAPGGSVGPHVDNYDVFLVQTRGHRHWQWTGKPIPTDQDASDQLRLVQPLSGAEEETAGPGDVLYLNPGVAHHGIARDLCVTCSIGMRAPQLSELSGRALDADDEFYSDADLSLDEVEPGYLSPAAVRRAAQLLESHGLDSTDAERMLGCFATTPKEWLQPEAPESALSAGRPIEVHGMARLVWSDHWVFANGRSQALPAAARKQVARLAAARSMAAPDLEEWLATPELAALLEWMWSAGLFDESGNAAGAI